MPRLKEKQNKVVVDLYPSRIKLFIMGNRIFLAVSILLFTACGGDDSSYETVDSSIASADSVSVAPPAPAEEQVKFKVYDRQNNPLDLTYDNNIVYCTCATWCPFSKKFVELLNDPKYQSVANQYKIVFLFHRPEEEDCLDQLRGNTEEMEQARSRIRTLFTTQDEFDPGMYADLPGKYYFFRQDFNKGRGGFPSAYDSQTGAFTANPLEIMLRINPDNKPVLDEMLEIYNHAEDDQSSN
jgi:hypothetical protein